MGAVVFEVGKVAPPPFWPSNIKDGSVLTQDAGGGVIVAIYINKPTLKELEELNQSIMACYLVQDDGCGLWLLGFGARPFIFELTQDPTLYDRGNLVYRLGAWVTNNLWHISVIDSSTGKVKNNRIATAPEAFCQSIYAAMKRAIGTPGFSATYKEFRALHRQIPLKDLWNKGTIAGFFGLKD